MALDQRDPGIEDWASTPTANDLRQVAGLRLPDPPTRFADPDALGFHAFSLSRALSVAEATVLDAHRTAILAKRALVDAEDMLWIGGQVQGKNADERAAWLRQNTIALRRSHEQAEHRLREAQAQRELVLEEMRTCRAVLNAMGGRG
jgi:hypothetical protein